MELHHAFERVEFRVFVDQHGIQPFRRGRHKRIGKRELVRRLQFRRFAAQRVVLVVPANRLLFHPSN